MNRSSSEDGSEPGSLRNRLLELRNALLALHKALIDSERVTFEKSMGAIQSPNHFLHLLANDPWFTWLQPMSSLIVAMDERLAQNEPLPIGEWNALISEFRRILTPVEHGDGFSGHYFEALQRDPHVVLAHAQAVKSLGPREPPE